MTDQPAARGELVTPDQMVPMSGDDLERIDAVGGCDELEFTPLVQTALFYRQQAMDLRDALVEAARALDVAGFCHSADKARAALREQSDGSGS